MLTAAFHSRNTLYSNVTATQNTSRDVRSRASIDCVFRVGYAYPRTDYFYTRSGVILSSDHGVSMQKCIQNCRVKNSSKSVHWVCFLSFACNDADCVAVDYHIYHRICFLLKTVGTISADDKSSTCLVKYRSKILFFSQTWLSKSSISDGDDPCNEVYFLKGFVRYGFYYTVFYTASNVSSAKDCCIKCREDPTLSMPSVSLSFLDCSSLS